MTGRCALLLALCLLAGSVQAAVTASVDRSRMGSDESFTLMLQATDGEDLQQTDLSPLLADFEVLDRSSSSNITIANGKTRRTAELHLTLLPRRQGRLRVPALEVDGQYTRAIGVLVEADAGANSPGDIFFVETELSARRVYVQAQLLLTLRIYRAVALRDISFNGLQLAAAEVQEVERREGFREIDGIDYQVNELVFAVFPQRSGQLQIPALEISARQAAARQGLFALDNRGRLLRRRSTATSVEVLAIPAEFPAAAWLPAGALEIDAAWSLDPGQLSVGESITRTVTIRADGLTAAQLPALAEPQLDAVKVYPDRPETSQSGTAEGISSRAVSRTAWVATAAGNYQVAEISIPWWDTGSNQLRWATLPAQTLRVAAASPASAGPLPIEAPVQHNLPAAPTTLPWPWLSAALALGWLLSTLLLLRRGRPAAVPTAKQPPQTETLRRRLRTSCRLQDAAKSRALLLQLAEVLLPETDHPGIGDLQALGNREWQRALEELELALFGAESGNWEGGGRLMKALDAVLGETREKEGGGGSGQPLPPLYRA